MQNTDTRDSIDEVDIRLYTYILNENGYVRYTYDKN